MVQKPNGLEEYTGADLIILGFDPDGSPSTLPESDWRLHVVPVNSGGPHAGGWPDIVDYWQNSATWNSAAATGTWNKANS